MGLRQRWIARASWLSSIRPSPLSCSHGITLRRSNVSLAPRPTNRHFYLDAEGKEVFDLTFLSEPLGLPASRAYGFTQLEFGDRIGPEARYTIVRKLGWGMHSSTWLARDEQDRSFVAVKVLTGHMTLMYERAVMWEPEALEALSYGPPSIHYTPLINKFTIPGKGSSGSHLCYVFPLYGGDVRALSKSRTTRFPLPLAKRIALHLLRGLAHAHGCGVVHTDLKHDNIFFTTSMKTSDVERWLTEEPPRRHPPETSYDGVVQAAVSQHLPMISEEAALEAIYVLGDFGTAQPSRLHDNRTITTPPLRAPESFLGAEWDMPADIWSFGCLAFEFACGRGLFQYKVNTKFDLTKAENMLYQMMLFTGQQFQVEQLNISPSAIEYFDPEDSELRKHPTIFHWPIKALVKEWNIVTDEEASALTKFVERCLHLDPGDRPSANDLLSDPWFDDIL